MAFKIFYSWQSDLPGETNHLFIQNALNVSVSQLATGDISIDPVIDRDVLGLSGSPDINRAILDKIALADAFVADVSIVGAMEMPASKKMRHFPNPNVLVELGYALRAIGERRVILVMNTAFGVPDSLPFDLRSKRALGYDLRSAIAVSVNLKERFRFGKVLTQAIQDVMQYSAGNPKPVRVQIDGIILELSAEAKNAILKSQPEDPDLQDGLICSPSFGTTEVFAAMRDVAQEIVSLGLAERHDEMNYRLNRKGFQVRRDLQKSQP